MDFGIISLALAGVTMAGMRGVGNILAVLFSKVTLTSCLLCI